MFISAYCGCIACIGCIDGTGCICMGCIDGIGCIGCIGCIEGGMANMPCAPGIATCAFPDESRAASAAVIFSKVRVAPDASVICNTLGEVSFSAGARDISVTLRENRVYSDFMRLYDFLHA